MLIVERVQVEAKQEDEALGQAYDLLKEKVAEEFSKEDISLEVIEEKKFLGLFGSKKVYQAVLEVEESIDGSFEVKVKPDGIFLEVKLPQGNGAEVKIEMIERILAEKEITDINYAAISEALTIGNEEIKIADRNPELDRDAKVNVTISSDQMAVYLDYYPPLGGEKYSVEQIIEQVKEAGVVAGIRKEEFAADFAPQEKYENYLIAVGEEPVSGEDAKINFEFDLEQKKQKVKQLDDGNVDFYNLNRIINVEEGEILAIKTPSKEGEAGITVTGEEIPPEPVEDIELPVGENVEVSEDGLAIKAGMEGQVVYTQGAISVLDVHTVNGDLDLSTGNIDFSGNVIVKGNVNEGLEIKAKGNVQVKGSVYGGKIDSQGQVTIGKGFIGLNKGEINATGTVTVKFIENAILKTEEDLIVKDAIMHSDIDAGQQIISNQNKGLIVGGKVRAGKEIDAKIIGSSLATATEVCVGISPELRDEFETKQAEYQHKQEKLDETIKDLRVLKKKKEQSDGRLSNKKQKLLNQLTRQRFNIAGELEKLKIERDKLAQRLEKGKKGRIKVYDTIYSGVSLTIGTCSKKITKSKSHLQYYVDDEEIKTTSYS
ncbi:FapA family protein [Natroniella acetigena]|uniref:FapA family protein n=1 Tax=Natroniella acetigena TaxID=52004 RepID=UPI00200A9C63|nr:FapA family protein [Natroniella acetigena]MCK8826289.1 FapA family protein [Natroniella acetigena]